ncbi:unnamed protein product [Lupinus luteus]|uniref:Uncharacterized protein n=1 Tax=Lupinus luteus TaxID=3873 RepID=A0AAV1WTU5_LUPLU
MASEDSTQAKMDANLISKRTPHNYIYQGRHETGIRTNKKRKVCKCGIANTLRNGKTSKGDVPTEPIITSQHTEHVSWFSETRARKAAVSLRGQSNNEHSIFNQVVTYWLI